MKVVPLNPGQTPPVELDVAADSAAALDAPPEVWEQYKNLVKQTDALFGAQHYRDYHFLFSLSDHVAHFGLEHHESNDSRLWERALVEPNKRLLGAGLLSHEFVHSWNGKYRRPADLATPDYEKPMQTDLLWVYEGLTQYLGEILTGRMGQRTPEEFRDSLAYTAAELDHTPGRAWRNLQDTADGVPAMQDAPTQWKSWRRGLDYYPEDELNWLWADTIIRQQTHGQKSLDDFCRIFHGPPSGPPQVKTYTFDDIVNTLNQVAPYDWRGFWTERLTNHGPGAPLGGIEGSGWKVVYDETRSALVQALESEGKYDKRRILDRIAAESGRNSWRYRRRHAGSAGWNRSGHEGDCGQRQKIFVRCAVGCVARGQEQLRGAGVIGRKHGVLQDLQARLSRRRKISPPGAGRIEARFAERHY